jgi:hypothetical protein
MLTVIGGLLTSTIAGTIAIYRSWRDGIKLWLNSAVHFAYYADAWPPLYGQRNNTPTLMTTIVFVTSLAILPALVYFLLSIFAPMIDPQTLRFITGLVGFFCLLILNPFLILMVRDLHRRDFFAADPEDCWGQAEPVDSLNS